MRLVLKSSKIGFAVAAIFLLLAIVVVAWLFYSSATNPGDSGEGGVLLIFFAMPWVDIIPNRFIGLFSAIACILINAFLLYCLFGGLRFEKRP
jgi:hypothetical protein